MCIRDSIRCEAEVTSSDESVLLRKEVLLGEIPAGESAEVTLFTEGELVIPEDGREYLLSLYFYDTRELCWNDHSQYLSLIHIYSASGIRFRSDNRLNEPWFGKSG